MKDAKTLPIFIERDADTLKNIYFPGDQEYQDIITIVESIAKGFYMSFEQAAETLGYELGFAHNAYM